MARIALVERRDDIASLGRAVLLGRGHAVESFSGMNEAFEALRAESEPPDAVIAGASAPPAPRLSETVQLVRQLGPHVSALLMLPGKGDERALLEGLDAGADDVVLVPFKPADLAGRVSAALARARRRAAEDPDDPGTRIAPIRPGIAQRATSPITSDRNGATRLSAAHVSMYSILGEESKIAGATFDDYKLVRTIGVGGMGVVLEAIHVASGRPVALKILREDVAKERDAALRFLREAYVLQGIADRNVVKIEDIGRSEGRLFYAMELVQGENVAQRLERDGKIPVAEALRIGVGVARALAALARRGIVHRDVKPGNIFLGNGGGADGSVKLGDFGLAKRAFARCVTPVREPLGTPHYLAPEVVEGAAATPVSDLYSLGVVLHEMLAGDTPYEARDTMTLLYKVCHGPVADLAKTLEHVPDDVRAVIAKTLARDPRQRFPDGASLAKSLERCRMRVR